MTAKLLDFLPRPEYDRVRWDRISAALSAEVAPDADEPVPLTSGEVYSILYGETAEKMRQLVAFYKHSGKWNQECERQMTQIVKELQTLCETLAHATTRTK